MGSIPIAEGETELSAPAASVAVNDRLSYQMACTVKAFPRGEGGRAKRGRMRNGGRTNLGIGLIDGTTRQITARIPHQSPPGGGDSFPPGEAFWCGGSPLNDHLVVDGVGGGFGDGAQEGIRGGGAGGLAAGKQCTAKIGLGGGRI